MKKYNKLVRDKIPEYIRSKGGKPACHIADDREYWQKLKEKLVEEVDEFNEDENIEEFVDILEVMEMTAGFKGFDWQKIKEIKDKKAKERGRFKEKIILDES